MRFLTLLFRLSTSTALAAWATAFALAAPLESRSAYRFDHFPAAQTGIPGPLHGFARLPNGEIAALAAGGLFILKGGEWTRVAGIDWPETLVTLPNGRSLVGCAQGIVELAPDADGSYAVNPLNGSDAMRGLYPLKGVALARGSLFGLNGNILLEVDRWGEATRHQLANWSNGIFSIGDELFFLGGTEGGIGRWDSQKKEAINIGHLTEKVGYAWPLKFTTRAAGGVWILVDSHQIIGFDGQSTWIWPGSPALTQEAALVHGFAEVAPDRLVIGTQSPELLIFNEAGQIEQRIASSNGLGSAPVDHVFADTADVLWAGSAGDIARIEKAGTPTVVTAEQPDPTDGQAAGAASSQTQFASDDSTEIRQRLARVGLPIIEPMYGMDTGVRGASNDVVSLPRGELAVLTESGFFVFDGTRWYRQPGVDSPYCLLSLPGDRALVGCTQGIVELSPSALGGYQTKRLSPPESIEGLHALMHIETMDGQIFGLRGDQLLEIAPDGTYQRHKLPNWSVGLFAIDDKLYFAGGGNGGINQWDPETKSLIDLGHLTQPVNYAWPIRTTPRREGGVWILFNSNRVMGFDGKEAWLWPGSDALANRETQIKDLVEYAPGQLAFGTSSEGVLFFDQEGNANLQISKSHGLEDVNVSQIGMDAYGDLWAVTKTAVSRISTDRRTLVFDERHGLTEPVSVLAFFRNRLYIGTDAGLFVSREQSPGLGQTFALLDGNRGITDLQVYDDHLFVAGGQLKVIDPSGRLYQLSNEGATNLHQPSRHPTLMLSGNFKGSQSFEKINGRWIMKETLTGPGTEIFSMAESADGLIWGGLGIDQVARIRLDDRGNGQIDHLPITVPRPIGWSIVAQVEDKVYLNTAPSVHWDIETQTWTESPSMIYSVGSYPFGFPHVFGQTSDEAYVTSISTGGRSIRRPNASILGTIANLGGAFDSRAEGIVLDEEGIAWIGGPFGLLRAQEPLGATPSSDVAPRIHRVASLNDGAVLTDAALEDGRLVLQPNQTALRIEVTLPTFAAHRHNRYQIHIEGVDSVMPNFTSAPYREVTNLDPGSYRLQVRARDVTGRDSPLLELPFVLLPPWYLKPGMYLIYALSAVALIALIVRRSTQQHIRQARQLQGLVADRTQEIASKNAELQAQAKTLEKQNLELAEKSDELEATTESLTETVSRLQEAQEQLVATARTAGKAEIAINVLHNVGNVLNSINVSLSTLSQRVETSNVPKLARLAALVEEKQQDIAAFITADPRGQRIPEYLANLAQALGKETALIADEIASMGAQVEHIKRIIAAQQTHAKSHSLIDRINLRELCQTAFTILSSNALARRIQIVNDVPKDLELHTDKHRLLEIILNLVNNAQEAINAQTPEQGKITAFAELLPGGDSLVLRIADNGNGIDKSVQAKIFTHGFTTKASGHGFGLHSSANAAKALGGELSLSSSGTGLGATATLILPLRPPTPAARAQNEGSLPEAKAAALRD